MPRSSKSRFEPIQESVLIDKLVPGGQALGTLADGKKVFLWNALPGETVREFRPTKCKSHYLEGIATKIENPSKRRVAPEDDCYLATSPWQIMDYAYELEQKAELLRESFRQQGLGLPEGIQVETDQRDYFYRNKMEYALYYDHESAQILPAFHERGSHRKVPIVKSSIERPEIFTKAQEIVAELNARQEDARKYQSLLLRCDQTGKVSGGLYENHRPRTRFANLHDQLLGQDYSYSPNGFFQINLPVYELALKEIQKWVDTAKVLDLYAGVGTIGLSVARDKELTLVECDRAAFTELEKNAAESQNSRAQAVLAKSEEALSYIEPEQTVIVDPPRAGCDVKLLQKFLEVLPPTIVYLSCNPATQTRDLAILQANYKIVHVQPFNFFPRTPHLENLVVMGRK